MVAVADDEDAAARFGAQDIVDHARVAAGFQIEKR